MPPARASLLLWPLLAIVALCAPGFAEEVYTFEEGIAGCGCFEDNSIFSESQNSGGGTDGLFSGTNGQIQTRRALLKVDVSSIPPGSIITSVDLEMTVDMSGDNFGDIAYALHRLTHAWGEGSVGGLSGGGFGAPGEPGDATWTDAKLGEELWSTPGGDFVPVPSGSALAGRAGDLVLWTGSGLVEDVQRWLNNPGENHGWIVIGALEGESKRVKRFFSSEAAAFAPRLIVSVEPPAAELPIGSLLSLTVVACALMVTGFVRQTAVKFIH